MSLLAFLKTVRFEFPALNFTREIQNNFEGNARKIFLGVGVGTVINGCVVSLLLGMVIHATAQIQILKEKLSTLGDIPDSSAEVLSMFRVKLGNCARHYACITK